MKRSIKKIVSYYSLLLLILLIYGKTLYADEIMTQTKSMDLQANVKGTSASYYVEVPSEIQFGTISTTTDNIYPYTVQIYADQFAKGEAITISSSNSFELTQNHSEKAFPCYNYFETKTFSKSDIAEGQLSILKEDASKASEGNYTGTLYFEITYTDQLSEQNKGMANNTLNINTKIAGASVSGLHSFVNKAPKGKYTFTIEPAKSDTCKDGIASIASLISVGQEVGTSSFYDFHLEYDDGNEVTPITDTKDTVVEICIPMTSTKLDEVTAYRSHNGNVSLMQPLKDRPMSNYIDNTYYYDLSQSMIYYYTSRFSVFALNKEQSKNITSATNISNKTSILDVNTPTNFVGQLCLKKSTSFSETSMCNALFYKQVDMIVNGDTANLTMYVIDPIPMIRNKYFMI